LLTVLSRLAEPVNHPSAVQVLESKAADSA